MRWTGFFLNFISEFYSSKLTLWHTSNRDVFRKLTTTNSTTPLNWDRIFSDAQRIAGQQNTHPSLKFLLDDEISNLIAQVKNLVGTEHPLVKTAESLICNEKNDTCTNRLIVLLISKSAGHNNVDNPQDPISNGISLRQRKVADLTEMIHVAHQIHRKVVNISNTFSPNKSTKQDKQLGNKIAVVCGDYLLSNALKLMATLNDTKVVELMTNTLRNFPQAGFIGDHDCHGNSVSYSGMSLKTWEDKLYLLSGSLLALSCQSAMILASHGDHLQNEAFEFGKNVAFGWQIHNELQPFSDTQIHPPDKPFDLTSLPVVLHLKSDLDLLNYIRQRAENLNNVDFKLVRDAVLTSSAVDETKQIRENYTKNALSFLQVFDKSEARDALMNIIHLMQFQNPTDFL